MPTITDIFTQEPFSVIDLTAALEKMPFEERRLGQLGLFEANNLETDVVVIDEAEGILQILDDRPRGSDPQRAKKEPNKKTRAFKVPHMQFEDRILAASIMGKRRLGTTELENAVSKVNDKLAWMRRQVENTWEIHRLNAIKGNLLDADGSTLFNWFTEFNVLQTTHNFEFSAGTTNVREQVTTVMHKIEDVLDGIGFSGVHVIAGRNWFQELIKHPSVKETYLNFQAAAELRADQRQGFVFGDALFEEYRGMRNLPNSIGIVGDDEAYAIPTGVAGMFRANYAPADFMETVNQLGQPMYAKTAPDLKYNRWVDVLVETNPLFINTRPNAVVKLTKS